MGNSSHTADLSWLRNLVSRYICRSSIELEVKLLLTHCYALWTCLFIWTGAVYSQAYSMFWLFLSAYIETSIGFCETLVLVLLFSFPHSKWSRGCWGRTAFVSSQFCLIHYQHAQGYRPLNQSVEHLPKKAAPNAFQKSELLVACIFVSEADTEVDKNLCENKCLWLWDFLSCIRKATSISSSWSGSL